MTLLFALILVAATDLHWSWYMIAVGWWVVTVLMQRAMIRTQVRLAVREEAQAASEAMSDSLEGIMKEVRRVGPDPERN